MKLDKAAWLSIFLAVMLIITASFAQQFSAVTPSGAVTGCPTPVSGSNILCSVTDGYYASVSGAAYVKMTAAAVPLLTTIDCPTASISTGGHLTASGCTIK